MKKLLYLFFLTTTSIFANDVIPAETEIRGLLEDTPIKKIIDRLNRDNPDVKITELEVVLAIENELAFLPANADMKYVKKLKKMVADKILAKGCKITCFDEKNIFLILGLDVQPSNMVPDPGSPNLLRRIPIRVSYSEGRVIEEINVK